MSDPQAAPIGQHECFAVFTTTDEGTIATWKRSDGVIVEGVVVNAEPVGDLVAALGEHREAVEAIEALRRERQKIEDAA